MKFAIAKEHRVFFQKQGAIEFEGFFLQDQIHSLNSSVDQALARKAGIVKERVSHLSSDQVFAQGRDLWRQQEELRKFISQPRLLEIVADLIEKKPIRLGYDQLLPAQHGTGRPVYEEPLKAYPKFLQQTITLENMSCIQGVLCGLLIALNAKAEQEPLPLVNESVVNPFAVKEGNILLIHPQTPLDLSRLFQAPGQRFYLVVYAQALSLYRLQEQDPHTHEWKNLGYVFNDKLSDKLHPIIYR
jgi:hypothetical protein